LIQNLKSNHADTFSSLGQPSLSLLDMRIRSTWAMVMFVLRKNYLALCDDDATELGNAVRWRLIYSLIPAALPPIAFAAAMINKVN